MKTPEEIYAEKSGVDLDVINRYAASAVTIKVALEAIRAYHSQFERECEWKCNEMYFLPMCCAAVLYEHGITHDYIYCPFCGGKIKRI